MAHARQDIPYLLSKVKELEADVLRYKETAENYAGHVKAACSQIDQLESRLAAAEELAQILESVMPRVPHKFGCPRTMTGAPDCYCGLEETENQFRAALAKFRSVK